MKTPIEKKYIKATQALNFFAQKKNGKINKMKAIKLIYFADKLHLRKYGRPIIGDFYLAMKYGPVGSCAKRVAELDLDSNKDVLSYVKKYIKPADNNMSVCSIDGLDLSIFSETDIECLESAYEAYKDKDQFELADLTHVYPEWRKHKKELDSGRKKKVAMDYKDFFQEVSEDDPLFFENKSDLDSSKEIFEEQQDASSFFS